MMTRQQQIVIAGMVGLACVLAWGQVRQGGTGGRALDRNMRVGSGGVNAPVPNSYTVGRTGVADLTRTRGLSAFSGNAPSLSNQLSVTSSSNLSTFRRQSVGLSDIRSSNLYRPQSSVYDDPLQTTLTLPDITRVAATGQRPIVGQTQHQEATAVAKKLFVDATADYKPLMPRESLQELDGNTLGLEPLGDDGQTPLSRLAEQSDSRDLALRGGEGMFGGLSMSGRARLAKELRDFDLDEGEMELRPDEVDQQVRAKVDMREDRQVDSRADGTGPELARRLEAPADQADSEDEDFPGRRRIASQRNEPLAQRTDQTGDQLPAINQDTFVDLLVDLQNRQAEQADLPENPREVLLGRRKQPSLPEDQQNVEVREDRTIVLHDLAGRSKDPFNRYMTHAKSAMEAGKFYEAGRYYDLASLVRPKNPLARMGRSLAAFGAGEWLTSAINLREAIKLFPPLMEVHLDLPKLLPVENLADQLASLDNAIKHNERRDTLMFLGAFMYHNFGNREKARLYANRLLGYEDAPAIHSALANYILTGKAPAKTD